MMTSFKISFNILSNKDYGNSNFSTTNFHNLIKWYSSYKTILPISLN